MKKTLLYAIVAGFVLLLACNQPKPNQSEENASVDNAQSQTYKHDFNEYGFVLNAPCKLEDVSSQAKGDFLVNYGGVTEPNNPGKMAAYQLIVSRLPIGYKDLPKDELEAKIDDIIKSKMSGMTNLKAVSFGYEGYKGYAGETTHNGLGLKGVIFLKDNYIIALTVMTNNNLEAKFNAFTNGFKSVDTTNKKVNSEQNTSVSIQDLSFGYSVSAPCVLKQYSSQDVDYSYSGAINPDDQDNAIVYKVQVSTLPIRYSQMGEYDQKQIKNNLLGYLRSKDSYSACKVNVQQHFAYRTSYIESGFKFKECMILTDSHIIELMIFSKKGVSDKQFINFVYSLKKN